MDCRIFEWDQRYIDDRIKNECFQLLTTGKSACQELSIRHIFLSVAHGFLAKLTKLELPHTIVTVALKSGNGFTGNSTWHILKRSCRKDCLNHLHEDGCERILDCMCLANVQATHLTLTSLHSMQGAI